ncbi:delta-like protein 4 isoform X2 [Dendronephthya gigantea]|nr:delta-like protein 4 isoform X2 [Dendronephthya gigantea]
MQCLGHQGCQSVVFLTSKSEGNCLLSNEVNGAKSADSTSVTLIKTIRVATVCLTNVCEHGSTCTDTCTPPYYFCKCLPSYFHGDRCEINTKCEKTVPCRNSGTCSPNAAAPFYTCSCPYPFTGTNCETNIRCHNNPCHNGGHCNTQSHSPYYNCGCPWPFAGSTCASNTRCNGNPCQHGGTCHTQSGHPFFHCHCTTGRWGDHCEKNLLSW